VVARAREQSVKSEWPHHLAGAFVRVSLFFEITVIMLGMMQLCLPGMLAIGYAAWLVLCLVWSYKGSLQNIRLLPGIVFLKLLCHLETGKTVWLDPAKQLRSRRVSMGVLFFGLLMLTILLHRASYPLQNLRFTRMDTYSRVLSLQTLTHGHQWEPDGSVALFAPLVFFSGVDAPSAVRAGGAIFGMLLALSCAYAAFRFTGNGWAAYLALGLAGILPVYVADLHRVESGPSELAAVFWLLAVALLGVSLRSAACAAVTAVLIRPALDASTGAMMLCVVAGIAIAGFERWAPEVVRRGLQVTTACIFTVLLAANLSGREMDGPYQYEQAARASTEIARNFKRNDWLIISPVHELPFIYGQGWHVELLDFVASFRPEEARRPDFRLPYEAQDTFVFIEKEPLQPASSRGLVQAQVNLTQTLDPAVMYYGTTAGRAGIEFQAARLMAAYMSAHDNVSCFYEDSRIVIYRIRRQAPVQQGAR
jgi:hypothetical protein